MGITLAERMARMEEKVDNIDKNLTSFIQSADVKFASKLTERIVYGLCGVILLAFVTKLLNLW